jgi:hypothetical protein
MGATGRIRSQMKPPALKATRQISKKTPKNTHSGIRLAMSGASMKGK